jgi:hypothetical protein
MFLTCQKLGVESGVSKTCQELKYISNWSQGHSLSALWDISWTSENPERLVKIWLTNYQIENILKHQVSHSAQWWTSSTMSSATLHPEVGRTSLRHAHLNFKNVGQVLLQSSMSLQLPSISFRILHCFKNGLVIYGGPQYITISVQTNQWGNTRICDTRVLAGNEDARLDVPQLLDLLSEKPMEGASRAPQQQDTTIPMPSRGPVQWAFAL